MDEIDRRRKFTVERVEALREALNKTEAIAAGRACVYATGSYGRCEASQHSDLDIFIVGKGNGKKRPDATEESQLSRLDEICVKADLIRISRELKFPDFSRDGHYLVHYSVSQFTNALGKPEDDFTNTFTGRLLLLLESCALVEKKVYREVAEEVISQYWLDYEDHGSDFMPAFLANDILRLWRTFCVNYEAFTDREPDIKRAKRKIQNYKLKHSRLMTCYSAILYLLLIYRKNRTVTPLDAVRMFEKSPTHRIQEMAADEYLLDSWATLNALLQQYEKFLVATNMSEEQLIERFRDKLESRELTAASTKFGDLMFEALTKIGNSSPFHRMLVV